MFLKLRKLYKPQASSLETSSFENTVLAEKHYHQRGIVEHGFCGVTAPE
jgi:hypothetical protein